MTLPTDSQARKDIPMARGLLDYFPDALAEVAYVSHCSNEKHNPGEPLHWSKAKSSDHADCLVRHVVERGTIDPDDGLRHSAKAAWRALAMLQIELEAEANLPSQTPMSLREAQDAARRIMSGVQAGRQQPPIEFGGVKLPAYGADRGKAAREAMSVQYRDARKMSGYELMQEAERRAHGGTTH